MTRPRASWSGALESAFAYDARVIVEAAARGIEVECGVLGKLAAERAHGGAPALASTPGEIVFEGDFYDFDAKYAPGGMELLVPARISAQRRGARARAGARGVRARRLRRAWRASTSSSTASTCW